jgi:cation diffusion facilitator family transporter
MTSETAEKLRGQALAFAGFALVIDTLMALFKIGVGLFSGSHALLASALYSVNDVLSAIAVTVSLRTGYRRPDADHPYGRGKAEFIAVGIVSLSIAIGVFLMFLYSVVDVVKGVPGPPHAIALVVALVSAVVNWQLTKRGRRLADRLQSPALTTSAEHHLADTLGSAAAIFGAGAALFGMHTADRFVAIGETIHLVLLSGVLLGRSTRGLMDAALDREDTALIEQACSSVRGVRSVVAIRSRRLGKDIWVEVAVAISGRFRVARAHELRLEVDRAVRSVVGEAAVTLVRFQSPSSVFPEPGPAGSSHA